MGGLRQRIDHPKKLLLEPVRLGFPHRSDSQPRYRAEVLSRGLLTLLESDFCLMGLKHIGLYCSPDYFHIKLRSGIDDQLLTHLSEGKGFSIRSVREHCVDCITDFDDTGSWWNL